MKDKAYWKAYNQKRQAYLKQKKQESRQRLKGQSTTDQTSKVVDTNQASLVVDHQVVDIPKVVDSKTKLVVDKPVADQRKVVDNSSSQVVDQKAVVDTPTLARLIQTWQTGTNYNCASTCAHSYCSNCWYFVQHQLVNYKGII